MTPAWTRSRRGAPTPGHSPRRRVPVAPLDADRGFAGRESGAGHPVATDTLRRRSGQRERRGGHDGQPGRRVSPRRSRARGRPGAGSFRLVRSRPARVRAGVRLPGGERLIAASEAGIDVLRVVGRSLLSERPIAPPSATLGPEPEGVRVTTLAASGSWIAAGTSAPGVVWLWPTSVLDTGPAGSKPRELALPKDERSDVRVVAFSADGHHVAAGLSDGKVGSGRSRGEGTRASRARAAGPSTPLRSRRRGTSWPPRVGTESCVNGSSDSRERLTRRTSGAWRRGSWRAASTTEPSVPSPSLRTAGPS